MPTALFRPGDRPLVNLGLLGLTVATTFSAFYQGFGSNIGPALSERVSASLLFSFTLVAILGAHEMGHYVYARLHGVDTSLPYFIPLPVLGVGTLGAVIRIRGRIPSRNALVDIGAAGPLAGLLVAIPLLAIGFARSTVENVPVLPPSHLPGEWSLWSLGGSLIHSLMVRLGAAAAGPPVLPDTRMVTVFGDNLLLLALQWLVVGPLPPGKEVALHPMLLAGWFGLLVTMINLIPIGQLDGGHVCFAVLGRKARRVGQAAALALLGLCLFASASWLLWLLITSKLIGFGHPEVVVPDEPLTRGRKVVAALCLIAFVLCVIPIPLTQVTLP